MKTFNGMIGIVEEGDNTCLSIATRKHSAMDILTFGHFPKPSYHHLGIYIGVDSKDYERGDNVIVTFKDPNESILESLFDIFTLKANIIKIEKTHRMI